MGGTLVSPTAIESSPIFAVSVYVRSSGSSRSSAVFTTYTNGEGLDRC